MDRRRRTLSHLKYVLDCESTKKDFIKFLNAGTFEKPIFGSLIASNSSDYELDMIENGYLSQDFHHPTNQPSSEIKKKTRYIVALGLEDKINCIKLLEYLKDNIQLNENTYPFGKNNYVDILYDVRHLSECFKYVYKIDVKDAFNSVDMKILKDILVENEIDHRTINLIDEIYNLTIVCKVNNEYSRVQNCKLHLGIPTSNFLFEVYINSILHCIKNKFICFVDDILIFGDDENSVKRDFKNLVKNLNKIKLEINTEKTKFIDLERDNLLFFNRYVKVNSYSDVDIKLLSKKNSLHFIEIRKLEISFWLKIAYSRRKRQQLKSRILSRK